MKKWAILFIALLTVQTAVALTVIETPVEDVILSDIGQNAKFNIEITNPGASDEFTVKQLYGGIYIHSEPLTIGKGNTRTIPIEIEILDKKPTGYYTFDYVIKSKITGVAQEEKLTLKIINLEDAFEIGIDNINIDSESVYLYIQNKERYQFDNMAVQFKSAFFETFEAMSLSKYEKEEFDIPLDQGKLKTLIAGFYALTTIISYNGTVAEITTNIKLLEKSGISVNDESHGIIIRERVIEKKNEGNLPTVVEVTAKKSIISRIFTSFTIEPDKVDRNFLSVQYTWQRELKPAESFRVKVTTNWMFPFILAIVIGTFIFVFKRFRESHLILKKRVAFVKTKSGNFALKVILSARAVDYVERINIVEKLPAMVKLYERYGTSPPNRIDEKNRRLEWHLDTLNKGEERIFTYIIYSNINVVGKFMLPPATAVYEKDGKIHEAESNQAIFLNEQRQPRD